MTPRILPTSPSLPATPQEGSSWENANSHKERVAAPTPKDPVALPLTQTAPAALRPGQKLLLRGIQNPEKSQEKGISKSEWKEKIRKERDAFLLTLRWLKAKGARLKDLPHAILLPEQLLNQENRRAHPERVAFMAQLSGKAQRLPERGDEPGIYLFENFQVKWFSWKEGPAVNPASLLAEEGSALLERAAGLSDRRERKTEVVPYTLHLHHDGEKVHVLFWNWLEEEPFLETSYSMDDLEGEAAQRAFGEEMQRQYLLHRKRFDFSKSLASLPALQADERKALEMSEVFRRAEAGERPAKEVREGRRDWRRLARSFAVFLDAKSFSAKTDHDAERTFLTLESSALELETRDLRRTKLDIMQIRGSLEEIALGVKSKAEQRVLYREFAKAGLLEERLDRFGNLVIPVYGVDAWTGHHHLYGFKVFPPRRFLDATETKEKNSFHGLDLSPWGQGEYPELFRLPALSPERRPENHHPYFLYSQLENRPETDSEALYRRASEGLKSAELYFGIQPGTLLKRIVLLPSHEKNASVSWSNPDTVFLWEQILTELELGKADSVFTHEAFHGLDAHFGFTRDPKFVALFDRFRESGENSFFRALNESELYDETGGHSSDNVMEFFASLTNGLLSPLWEDKVKEWQPRDRALYYHSLRDLRRVLLEAHPPLKQAPIVELIDRRLKALLDIAVRLDGAKSYPALSSLLRPSLEKSLAQGDPPILPISSWELKNAARGLTGRKPLLIYIYNGDEHESLSKVRAVARLLAGTVEIRSLPHWMAQDPRVMDRLFQGHIATNHFTCLHRGQSKIIGDMGTWLSRSPESSAETIRQTLRSPRPGRR